MSRFLDAGQYAWHDARVQRVPELFVPADAPPERIQKAIDDYPLAAMSPERSETRRLEPGPGVVRCVRRLVARTRDGLAITVALGGARPIGCVVRTAVAVVLRLVGRLSRITSTHTGRPRTSGRPELGRGNKVPVASSDSSPGRDELRHALVL